MISTKFRVLVEIAAHQPNIRQMDIAAKLKITPQAVSEYVKQLIKEGHVSSGGPLKYKATNEGVELILQGADELKNYCRFIREEVVRGVRVFTAIADENLKKDQKIKLWMYDGLLRAGKKTGGNATGIVISDAEKGEDVGVTNLEGIIELEKGKVEVYRVPRVEIGGSRSIDYKMLRKELKDKKFICAFGVEALVALRKINKKPKVFFGVKEAVIEASHHGISSVVVGVDDELPELLRRLEVADINYSIVDIREKM